MPGAANDLITVCVVAPKLTHMSRVSVSLRIRHEKNDGLEEAHLLLASMKPTPPISPVSTQARDVPMSNHKLGKWRSGDPFGNIILVFPMSIQAVGDLPQWASLGLSNN